MEWQNIISTLKKIGHELVIMDKEDTYVLMPFKRYDELLNSQRDIKQMSEEELIQNINQQVADWRVSQQQIEQESEINLADKSVSSADNDDMFYIEPVE